MTEQKLREALRIAVGYIDMDALYTFAGGDHDTIKEALATTELEPTGMPELLEPDHKADRWPTSHVYTTNQMRDYGEQCWKAGYKHGAWDDKPAVNQQLTTEPLTNDTKDALMAGRAYAQEALIRFDDAYDRHPSTEPERNAILTDIQLIDAAMAQGVKG